MVRVANLDDAARVAEIYAYYVEQTPVSFEEVAPDAVEMASRMEATLSRLPWLVFDDGEVRGYAYAIAHKARASYRWSVDVSIYLDAACKGKGIGRALYAELLSLLRRQGYRRAHAGITLPNEASVGIHRAFGFEEVGTYPNVGYKFGRWHDTYWMTLELLPPAENPPEPILFPELTE